MERTEEERRLGVGGVETLAEDTSANSDSRAERPQKSESDRADQIVVTEHNSVS